MRQEGSDWFGWLPNGSDAYDSQLQAKGAVQDGFWGFDRHCRFNYVCRMAGSKLCKCRKKVIAGMGFDDYDMAFSYDDKRLVEPCLDFGV